MEIVPYSALISTSTLVLALPFVKDFVSHIKELIQLKVILTTYFSSFFVSPTFI